MPWRCVCIVVFIAVACTGYAFDFETPIIGHWSRNTSNGANAIVVSGTHAFLADAERGVQIIDVTDPSKPRWTASVPTIDAAQDLVYADSHLYVADRDGGVVIIDVNNPSSPARVGALPITNCYRIYVSGGHAYVTRRQSGLVIVDVRQPSSPVLAAEVPLPGGWADDVGARGSRAYVLVNSAFVTLDVSIPTQPKIISTNEAGWSLTVEGNLLYTGLAVFDITNPEAPVALPGTPRGGLVSGGYSAVVHGEDGIEFFDVTQPTNAIRIGYFSGELPAAFMSGNYGYVIDRAPGYAPRDSGLYIVDLRARANPQRQANRRSSSRALHSVAVVDHYAYVSSGELSDPRILVFSITNGTITLLNRVVAPANGPLAASGNRLYGADWKTIRIVDVSSPDQPTFLGSYVHSATIADLAAGSNFVYVASWDNFVILDSRNTASNIFELSGATACLDVFGDRLCLENPGIGNEGFTLVDISNPYEPKTLSVFTNSSQASHVCLTRDFVYFVDFNYYLHAVNIQDPARPRLTASVPVNTWWIEDLDVYDGYAYLAASNRGLIVFDVRDPTNLRYVGGNASFECRGIAEMNGSICAVADRFNVLDKFHPLSVAITSISSGAQQHTLSLSAPPRQDVLLQSSSNLIDWAELRRVSITNPPLSVTVTNADARTFYRAVWP